MLILRILGVASTKEDQVNPRDILYKDDNTFMKLRFGADFQLVFI